MKRLSAWWAKVPEGLRAALFVYLSFRLPLELLLGWSSGTIPQGPGTTGMPPLDGPAWFQAWLRWDSGWYVRIIKDGYAYSSCLHDGDPCQQSSIAFFPLFPMLSRLPMKLGFSMSVSTFIVSHVALIFALWGLHRLATKLIGPDGALPAMAALVVFPMSIFLSAAYAEALLIAFGVWAYVYFEEDRPLLAAICIGFAAATRSHGSLLAFGLVVGAVLKRRWLMAFAISVATTLVMGTYMTWLQLTYGDALAFAHARKAWGYVGPAWGHVKYYYESTVRGDFALEGWGDLAAAPWLLVIGILAWRRFGPAYGVFVLAIFATAAQAGQLWALGRIALCAIPAFLIIAQWAMKPKVRVALLAAGMCWVAMSGFRFVNGWHTGN